MSSLHLSLARQNQIYAKSGMLDWHRVTAKGNNTRAKACLLLSTYPHTEHMVALVIWFLAKRWEPLTLVRQSALHHTALVAICE